MKKNKRLVFFSVLCLLLGVLSGTVSAEELEKIGTTDTELFASAQDLSAEEVCELLEADESVEHIIAFEDEVYFIDSQTLYRYDTVTDSLTVAYNGEIEVNYYIPNEYGVVIGTEAPVSDNGIVHTALEYEEGLEWPGDYYFYNNESKELTMIDDPDWSLLVYSTKGVSSVSYSTSINGKAIPSSAYPVGSIYSGSDNGGTQCHGFGYAIIKYLYGSYSNVTKYSLNRALSASEIKNYSNGSMIRAYIGDHQHTMIKIGSDSGGIYVYHANWNITNGVEISYITNSTFGSSGTFYKIEYILQHNHSCLSWAYFNSTQHKGTCSTCSATLYEDHTLDSNRACTKCDTDYINKNNGSVVN